MAAFFRHLFGRISEHDLSSLAAAIAYYTSLSLSPLVLLALAVIGGVYPSAQARFIHEIGALVGPQGQGAIQAIVDSASTHPDLRQWAGWIAVVVLLFGATGVFAQLQTSLNRIWDMQSLSGLRGFLRRRLLSAGVLLSLLFLTIVSFLVQALLALTPWAGTAALRLVWSAAVFVLYSLLFAALYRWLPDRRIPWWTALRGGAITTLLFSLGRALLGLYLAHSNAAGAFGPAGALIVWLVWAYYSGIVFLFSAELVNSLAHRAHWDWWREVAREPAPAQQDSSPLHG